MGYNIVFIHFYQKQPQEYLKNIKTGADIFMEFELLANTVKIHEIIIYLK